jgi:hypothetical protein
LHTRKCREDSSSKFIHMAHNRTLVDWET